MVLLSAVTDSSAFRKMDAVKGHFARIFLDRTENICYTDNRVPARMTDRTEVHTERYRSGHNEAVLKTVSHIGMVFPESPLFARVYGDLKIKYFAFSPHSFSSFSEV